MAPARRAADESLRTAVTLQHPVALFAEGDPSFRPFQRLANALDDDPPQGPDAAFSRFWRGRLEGSPPAPRSTAGSAEDDGFEATAPPATAVQEAVDSPAGETPPPEVDADEGLDPLRRAFETALEVADPEALAEVLNTLHEQYRARTGRPAIKGVEPSVDAPSEEAASPEVAEDVALGEALAPADPPSPGGPAGRDAVPAADTRTPDPPPDFGWRAADPDPGIPGRQRTSRAPGFDHERFGSQDALLARLRELEGRDVDLAEFLRRL